jgi:hypothetical protein
MLMAEISLSTAAMEKTARVATEVFDSNARVAESNARVASDAFGSIELTHVNSMARIEKDLFGSEPNVPAAAVLPFEDIEPLPKGNTPAPRSVIGTGLPPGGIMFGTTLVQVSFSSQIHTRGSAGTNPFISGSSPQTAAAASAPSLEFGGSFGSSFSTPTKKVATKKAVTTLGKKAGAKKPVTTFGAPPKTALVFATPGKKPARKKASTTPRKKPEIILADKYEPTHKIIAGEFAGFEAFVSDGSGRVILVNNARGKEMKHPFDVTRKVDSSQMKELDHKDMLEFAANLVDEPDEDPEFLAAESVMWECPKCHSAVSSDEPSCPKVVNSTTWERCGGRRAAPPGGPIGWGDALAINQVSLILFNTHGSCAAMKC